MALNNSQYQNIMRSYDQTRLSHMREREARIEEIYTHIPELRRMDENVGALAAGKAKALLSGDNTALAELKSQLALIRERKQKLLTESGYGADALEMRYDCPHCKDTGYINGEKCRCFKKKEIALLYEQSSLECVLQKENFDTFHAEWFSPNRIDKKMSPRDNILKIEKICLQMAEDYEHEKQSLLFTGTAGTGKTFMSHCIAKALMDRCFSVLYLSADSLFDVFQKHQFQDEKNPDAELMYEHIFDCDLLIIDDLGTESTNSFTISCLFSCINERSMRGLGNVISTNLSLPQISERYTERISSRIISDYRVLEFYGPDVRLHKRLGIM